jgi:hypothetical protein
MNVWGPAPAAAVKIVSSGIACFLPVTAAFIHLRPWFTTNIGITCRRLDGRCVSTCAATSLRS